MIVAAWITLFISFLTDNRVPLYNFGWFTFRSMIMIDPTFNCKLYSGVPGTLSEFKIFVGHAVNGFVRMQFSAIWLWIMQFKLSASLFFAASIAHSLRQCITPSIGLWHKSQHRAIIIYLVNFSIQNSRKTSFNNFWFFQFPDFSGGFSQNFLS